MGLAGRNTGACLLLLAAALPTSGAAQEPSLDTVLARTAEYVAQFQQQLSGIVAEESYVQEVRGSSTGGRTYGSGAVQRRQLKSDLLLVLPRGEERHVEFRDVFEVDGHAVRDRQDRLTKLFLDPSAAAGNQVASIIAESARYNIGNIPRNINTPMLSLLFLQRSSQHRFRFRRVRSAAPDLTTFGVLARSDSDGNVFRTSTEMWVIAFDERKRDTIIHTNDGKDFPSRGRFWIDPASGAVLMSELVMDGIDVHSVIDVSYQSEQLLGFRVPAEMRERYRARFDRVEGVATYGRFRQFQVNTGEQIGAPVKPPPKPPPQESGSRP